MTFNYIISIVADIVLRFISNVFDRYTLSESDLTLTLLAFKAN